MILRILLQKALGPDRVTNKALRYLHPRAIATLTSLFNDVYEEYIHTCLTYGALAWFVLVSVMKCLWLRAAVAQTAYSRKRFEQKDLQYVLPRDLIPVATPPRLSPIPTNHRHSTLC